MTQRRAPPKIPSVAETIGNTAFPTAIWKLDPDREGLCPVANGRGGPFNISWEIHGDGPVKLVFVMGLGSFKSAWQRQTLHFGHERRSRYSMLILDNRGMGDSDKPLIWYSTSEMAKDVMDVLRHIGWLNPPAERTLHLIGISLGGMICQELANLIPETVSTLNLCCTAAAIENTTTFWENMTTRASMLMPKTLERTVFDSAHMIFARNWLVAPDTVHLPDPQTTPKCRPPGPGVDKYLMFETNAQRYVAQDMHKRLDPQRFTLKGFVLQLIAAGWHRKSPQQLKTLADRVGRERILILHGTEDNTISVPHGRKLIQIMKPEVGLILEGIGHAPIVERTDWFNQLLEDRVEVGEKLDGRL